MYEKDFDLIIGNNAILNKHRSLLKTFSDDRIMCVGTTDDDGFFMVECCDEWFHHRLTKEECLELSELFKEIAEVIEE